jgi:superkiller protein 3
MQLPALYDAVLNHPDTSDEFRIEIEGKQLRHKYDYLVAIPDLGHIALKQKLSMEVDDLVDTIVLLRKRDELGWKVYFQGRDCYEMCKTSVVLRLGEWLMLVKLSMTVNMYGNTSVCFLIRHLRRCGEVISHLSRCLCGTTTKPLLYPHLMILWTL